MAAGATTYTQQPRARLSNNWPHHANTRRRPEVRVPRGKFPAVFARVTIFTCFPSLSASPAQGSTSDAPRKHESVFSFAVNESNYPEGYVNVVRWR